MQKKMVEIVWSVKRKSVKRNSIFIVIVCAVFVVSTNGYGQYFAGAAVLDLTPTLSEAVDSCLGGYGVPFSRCGITQVNDPITVRALALADQKTLWIFVAIDSVGLGDNLRAQIKQKVAELSAGAISTSSIKLSATHTHSGPDLQGLWGGVSDEYLQRVIQQSSQAIVLSVLSLQPVHLRFNKVEVDVRNRRGWHQVDDEAFLLVAYSSASYLPIAALASLSAHPTILSTEHLAYSSDYVHYLRQTVQTEVGVTTLFINGMLGDAEPDVAVRSFQQAQSFGAEVGQQLVQGAGEKAELLSGNLQARSFKFESEIEPWMFLLMIYAGLLDVELLDFNKVELNTYLLKVGDRLSILTFPGEALSRMGLPIKAAMHTEHAFILGVTEGSYGYFIPSDEFGQVQDRHTEERAAINERIGDDLQKGVLKKLIKHQLDLNQILPTPNGG